MFDVEQFADELLTKLTAKYPISVEYNIIKMKGMAVVFVLPVPDGKIRLIASINANKDRNEQMDKCEQSVSEQIDNWEKVKSYGNI